MVNEDDSFNVSWVIGGLNMEQDIELNDIRDGIGGERWEDATSQPGVRVRLWDDESEFVTFFSTGKCIVGAREVERIEEMKDDLVNKLKSLDILDSDFEVEAKINNIVAKADIGDKIDLIPLQVHLGYENTEYEPEQFPGLVYNMNCTVMIFSSGKIILTGGNKVSDNLECYKDLIKQISDYQEDEKERPWSY